MAYELRLPPALRQAGWKVKIQNAEGPEEPHVTILRKRRKWRVSLRTREFLYPGGRRSQIDKRLWQILDGAWGTLGNEWDKMYPHNQVRSEDDDQGNQEST
jgi:hypothetical protein